MTAMPREVVASVAFVLVLAGLVVGWAVWSPTPPAPAPVPPPTGLANLRQLNDHVLSGGTPAGAAGFASLQRLGVRTVLSVDGAAPEVELAARFGLRYVHIPVGYDGIPTPTAWRIARAVRDLPGPVYVHCHHGKHRGPAAAVVVRLCLDPTFGPADARDFLTAAGTDPRYRGLVTLPDMLPRPTAADLDAVPLDFPPTAAVPDFVRHMVAIDVLAGRLKATAKAGWPDPAAAADDAWQLHELYRESQRLPVVERHGPAFAAGLSEAEATARSLSDALRTDPAAAGPVWVRAERQCASCHARWRDGTD